MIIVANVFPQRMRAPLPPALHRCFTRCQRNSPLRLCAHSFRCWLRAVELRVSAGPPFPPVDCAPHHPDQRKQLWTGFVSTGDSVPSGCKGSKHPADSTPILIIAGTTRDSKWWVDMWLILLQFSFGRQGILNGSTEASMRTIIPAGALRSFWGKRNNYAALFLIASSM